MQTHLAGPGHCASRCCWRGEIADVLAVDQKQRSLGLWPQAHLAHPEDNDLPDQQAQRLWGVLMRTQALGQPACGGSCQSDMLLLGCELEPHAADGDGPSMSNSASAEECSSAGQSGIDDVCRCPGCTIQMCAARHQLRLFCRASQAPTAQGGPGMATRRRHAHVSTSHACPWCSPCALYRTALGTGCRWSSAATSVR